MASKPAGNSALRRMLTQQNSIHSDNIGPSHFAGPRWRLFLRKKRITEKGYFIID